MMTLSSCLKRGGKMPPDFVIVGSFRYYLGRATYAVNTYCTWLCANVDRIDDRTLLLISSEIKDALDSNRAGMQCDKEDWQNVLRHVDAEIKKRGE